MKKRMLVLVAMIGVMATMVACGDKETASNTGGSVNVESQVQKEEIKEEIKEESKEEDRDYITKGEMSSYFGEPIELTTENWNEYFEIIEEEGYNIDAFGEKASDGWRHGHIIPKDGYFVIADDTVFRLSYHVVFKGTYGSEREYDESKDLNLGGFHMDDRWEIYGYEIGHTYEVSNMECEKVVGTVVPYSIPEDKWFVNEAGERYILYKRNNSSEPEPVVEGTHDFHSTMGSCIE